MCEIQVSGNQFADSTPVDSRHNVPATEAIEQRIREIWEDALGIPDVHSDQNFFDLVAGHIATALTAANVYVAERKRVEAQGIADYQRVISESLTDRQLQYESIKAQLELAKSPNAKIIVMGKSNTPLILDGNQK